MRRYFLPRGPEAFFSASGVSRYDIIFICKRFLANVEGVHFGLLRVSNFKFSHGVKEANSPSLAYFGIFWLDKIEAKSQKYPDPFSFQFPPSLMVDFPRWNCLGSLRSEWWAATVLDGQKSSGSFAMVLFFGWDTYSNHRIILWNEDALAVLPRKMGIDMRIYLPRMSLWYYVGFLK